MKTSPKRSYSVIENERFGLVFAKTGSIISGTGVENFCRTALLYSITINVPVVYMGRYEVVLRGDYP